ncbi:E3 ubiquitin-protein ligase RLIM-like [Branchiostoma floridae]|uniref:E3 ubiquitin-protein ligase RLIM-like n=1 Tax=Branchiostoma floridae TaxID=7739 RepID=A0A9J7KBL1_BRAFL|nr:E3 ubiquitin-protein ligase RLIM-like [Branchiostoma floridae]
MVATRQHSAVAIVTGLCGSWRNVMESLVVMVTAMSGPSTAGASEEAMMGNLGSSGTSSADRGGGFLRRSERIGRRLGLFSSARVGEAPSVPSTASASASDEPAEPRSRRRRGASCFPRRSRHHSRTRSRSPLESRSSSPTVSTASSSGYVTATPRTVESASQSSSQSSASSGRVRRTGARWAEFLARGSQSRRDSPGTAAGGDSSGGNGSSSTILNLSTLYPSGEFVTTTSNESTSTVHVRVRGPVRDSSQAATEPEVVPTGRFGFGYNLRSRARAQRAASTPPAGPAPAARSRPAVVPTGRFGYNLRSRARAQRAASTPPAGPTPAARSRPAARPTAESSPDEAGLRLADLLSLRISVRPTDRDTSSAAPESATAGQPDASEARGREDTGSAEARGREDSSSAGASSPESRGESAARAQGTRITIIRIRTAPSTPDLGSREGAQPRIAVSTHNVNGPTHASSTAARREDSTTEAAGNGSSSSTPSSESRSPGAAPASGPLRERISVMEFDTNGDSDNESDSDILEMINSRLRQVAARTEEQEGAIRPRRALSANQASPLTLVFLGIVISADGEDTPRGLTKEQIDTLPTRTFSEPSREENATNSCNVCITDYIEGSVLRCLPCTHEFHAVCVDRWLGINASCPVCRHTVTSEA